MKYLTTSHRKALSMFCSKNTKLKILENFALVVTNGINMLLEKKKSWFIQTESANKTK